MDIIQTIFNSAFMVLNLPITIPLDFECTKFLTFPLFIPFLIGGIIDIIIVVWTGILINRNSIN